MPISTQTIGLINQGFNPTKVPVDRFTKPLPDIMLVTDIEGCLIHYKHFRKAIHENLLASNIEAINKLKDRLLIVYATGQDSESVCYRDKYFHDTHIDVLFSDNGHELAINSKSLSTANWFGDYKSTVNNDWDNLISERLQIDRKSFFDILKTKIRKEGFQEISDLGEKEKDCRTFPHHIFYRKSYLTIALAQNQLGFDIVSEQPEQQDFISPFLRIVENARKEFEKRVKVQLAQNITTYPVGAYAFFSLEGDITISKAAVPSSVARVLPNGIVDSIRYVVGIGDSDNDLHLGLNNVELPSGRKIPVKSIISGQPKKKFDFLKDKQEEDIFIAPEKGNIGRCLVEVIKSLD